MSTASLHYKPEIDGLRAIAVLGVILFHIWPESLTGGFLGVDVFFVISGFLITTNIARRKDNGTFTLKDFYTRRIKRLFPVVILVALVTGIVASLLYLPKDVVEFWKSAFFSISQAANFYFAYFIDSGYFADSSAEKPLLHLWSLAVEEQFYLLWPLTLLMLLSVKSKFMRFGAVLALIVLSFYHGELTLQDHPEYAYYMVTTRGAELLGGALLALGMRDSLLPELKNMWVRSILAFVGLVGILYCFYAMNEADGFPGVSAVPITAFTSLLIYSGLSGRHILSLLLANRVAIFIGAISYSLYLWHWPILAFARYSFIDMTIVNGLVLLVLMFALSTLSYILVENRFRQQSYNFSETVTKFSIAPAIAVACVAMLTVKLDGFLPVRNWNAAKAAITSTENVKPALKYAEVLQKGRLKNSDLKARKHLINKKGARDPKVLLWGDSNSAQYVGLLREFAVAGNFSFRNAATSSCPPIIGKINHLVAAKVQKNCSHSRSIVGARLKRFDIIILGASWQAYDDRGNLFKPLTKMIDELTADGKQILLLTQMQRMEGLNRSCGARAVLNPLINCEKRFKLDTLINYSVNTKLRKLANKNPSVSIVDPTLWLCPDKICAAYYDNEPLYYDAGHIGYEAGAQIAKRVLETRGFPDELAILDRRIP